MCLSMKFSIPCVTFINLEAMKESLEYAWLISVFVSWLLWKWLCLRCISKNILVLNYSHVKLVIYEFGMAIQFLPTLTKIKLDYTSYWIGFCWSFCKVFLFNKNSDLGYRIYYVGDFLYSVFAYFCHLMALLYLKQAS